MRKFEFVLKRLFDIVVSCILIIILTVIPVFIVIPIIIRLTSKGPAVFKQERAGKDGKTFYIYKFRTMTIPPEGTYVINGVLYKPNGELLEPSTRITKVGAFLRKTSLDELMQLFNILNGTMSFVGPRPTLPYQTERYDSEQRKRLNMRPGITGWAQVNGRNNLTWTEKIKFDVYYVENFNIWFDIKILFKTVGVIFKKEGIEFKNDDSITAKDDFIKSESQEKQLVD